MEQYAFNYYCILFLLNLCFFKVSCMDPTVGFTEVTLTEDNFVLQKPYNIPLRDRYCFKDGIRSLWVYSHDKPFKPHSPTKPRTEIRITGYDYTSGVWQFEGRVYIPKGTSGVSIMQIFGASETATTLMLRIYNGTMMYYQSRLVASNIYDKWLRLNVIHDVGKKKVKISIDGEKKLVVRDRGGSSHYFKFGVYAQNCDSNFMESRWKCIKIYRK